MSNLEALAHVSTIAQAVLVVVSLVLIWRQLKQGTELAKQSTQLARAANANALTDQAAAFNSLLIQNGDLAELWHRYGQSPEELSRTDSLRYREMMTQWLILHENIHFQRKAGLLDEEIYRSWENDLASTVIKHNLEPFIGDFDQLFSGSFLDQIKEIKRRKKTTHESANGEKQSDVAT